MTWQAGGETILHGYKFTYDGLNRMLDAIYGEGTSLNSNTNRFTEKVTGYDKNGNILALQRYGQTGTSTYGLIDNLTFTLDGNQLNRVDDAVTASAYNNGFEFKDAVKQANEYAYDANGNLTKDLNKNISNIQYNSLNLPSKVTFTDGSTIEYTYAADGTKLRTKHVINGTTTTTDYCGNVIYENGVQKLLLTEAGYLTLADSKYHYYLQDHQGNNRVVIDQNGTIEETNHYYPFGGVFANSTSVQPYKYNGKELDTKKGLNWYDYGARHYDAAIGRFATVDPSSESYYETSPYAYCGNNPVVRIDPTGADWYQNNGTYYYTWFQGNQTREGYTYIGERGSVLGEFEPIIDDLLTNVFLRESLYSEGFTFDIVPNDKGALLGSKERDWDFFSEFVNGTGPEFSVFLSDHPYTEEMKTAKDVRKGQQRIMNGESDIPGQITEWPGNWGVWDALTTFSMAKQFIGSYRYDAFTSRDGKYLNNVISDSKSMSSLLYHLYPSSKNPNRKQQKIMGTTYQFYIWQSKK
jgi:RHS repeat-associated protein